MVDNVAYLRTRYRDAEIPGVHDNNLSCDRVRKLLLRQREVMPFCSIDYKTSEVVFLVARSQVVGKVLISQAIVCEMR